MLDLEDILKLCRDGQDEKARGQLVALAGQFPSDPNILFETACVHDRLGLESDAIPFYLAAMRNGISGDKLREAYLGWAAVIGFSDAMRNPGRSLKKVSPAFQTLQN